MNRKQIVIATAGLAAVISCAVWLKLSATRPAPLASAPRREDNHRQARPDSATANPAPRATILKVLGTNFWARLEAATQLPHDLSQAELHSLFQFLEGNSYSNDEKLRASERVLKNEILNALHRQSQPVPELEGLLIRLYRDKTQDAAIRDYALQHLETWAEQMLSGSQTQPAWAARRSAIAAVFAEAIKESHSTLAGTALINWQQLSIHDQSIDGAAISNAALALANDPQSASASKAVAIQICCLRGMKEVLEPAKDLAQHAAQLPLRLSAIAAVGALGEDDQLDFLKVLERTGELPVQTAARAAIQRVQRPSMRSPSHTP